MNGFRFLFVAEHSPYGEYHYHRCTTYTTCMYIALICTPHNTVYMYNRSVPCKDCLVFERFMLCESTIEVSKTTFAS